MAYNKETNEPLGFDEDDPAVFSRTQTPFNPGATPFRPSLLGEQQEQGGYAPYQGAYPAAPGISASGSGFAAASSSAPQTFSLLPLLTARNQGYSTPPASAAGTALPLGSSFRNERGFVPGPATPQQDTGHTYRDYYNQLSPGAFQFPRANPPFLLPSITSLFGPSPASMSAAGAGLTALGGRASAPTSNEQQGRQYAPSKPDGSPFSVKYLTCWYWAHTRCKKPEWECAYSHHHTGIMSEMPVQKGPGQPMVAGANARKAAPVFTDWRNIRNVPSLAGQGQQLSPGFAPPGYSRLAENTQLAHSLAHSHHGSAAVASSSHVGLTQGAEASSSETDQTRRLSSQFREQLPSLPSSATPTRSTFPPAQADTSPDALRQIISMQTKLTSTFETAVEKVLKDSDQDLEALKTLLDQTKAGDTTLSQVTFLLERILNRSKERREMNWDAVNKFQNEKKTLKRVAEEEGMQLNL